MSINGAAENLNTDVHPKLVPYSYNIPRKLNIVLQEVHPLSNFHIQALQGKRVCQG